MDHFQLKNGILHAEDMPLDRIAADVGTPVYVYSRATLARHAAVFRDALKAVLPKVHLAFAVKSNPNLAVLRVLKNEGYGADVVSEGEMNRALAAGIPAADIVFSGVGKSRRELTAAVRAGIGQFNLESEEEGVELADIAAALGSKAVCALRVNPDVDAKTHAKISTGKAENKFGVAYDRAAGIYTRLAALDGLTMRGLAVHIGSQISDLGPSRQAFIKMGELMRALRDAGQSVTHMDLGGGLGVPYKQGVTVPFVVVDAAMNDLARPAMYDAWHDFAAIHPTGETMVAHIVGPICESSDTFAMGRTIDVVKPGDLGVFRTAGAYGATMANTYNSRALVPEVMVDGDRYAIVAERIEPESVMAAERIPDWLDA